MPPLSPPRRVNVNADLLEPSLRIVGYDPGQPLSLQIQECVRSYANLVMRAGLEVERMLDAPEWNLIADVMGGCLDIALYSDGPPLPASLLLAAQVEDGHRLDRLGEKWLAEDPAAADAAAAALLAKLRGLSELQCQAVLAAVRHFWAAEERPADWWRVRHRLPAKAGGR